MPAPYLPNGKNKRRPPRHRSIVLLTPALRAELTALSLQTGLTLQSIFVLGAIRVMADIYRCAGRPKTEVQEMLIHTVREEVMQAVKYGVR